MGCNEEVSDMAEMIMNEVTDCWKRESYAYRLVPNSQTFDKVKLFDLEVGDIVQTWNKQKNQLATEKIVYVHDHALEYNFSGS